MNTVVESRGRGRGRTFVGGGIYRAMVTISVCWMLAFVAGAWYGRQRMSTPVSAAGGSFSSPWQWTLSLRCEDLNGDNVDGGDVVPVDLDHWLAESWNEDNVTTTRCLGDGFCIMDGSESTGTSERRHVYWKTSIRDGPVRTVEVVSFGIVGESWGSASTSTLAETEPQHFVPPGCTIVRWSTLERASFKPSPRTDLDRLFAKHYQTKRVVVSVRTTLGAQVDVVDVMMVGGIVGDDIHSPQWERRFFYDGIFHGSSTRESSYHGAAVHPAMSLLAKEGRSLRVAIVGGGTGAHLREILTYDFVGSVTVVERDAEFVTLAREYLPQWNDCGGGVESTSGSENGEMQRIKNCCFDDPRVEMKHVDFKEWVAEQVLDDGSTDWLVDAEDQNCVADVSDEDDDDEEDEEDDDNVEGDDDEFENSLGNTNKKQTCDEKRGVEEPRQRYDVIFIDALDIRFFLDDNDSSDNLLLLSGLTRALNPKGVLQIPLGPSPKSNSPMEHPTHAWLKTALQDMGFRSLHVYEEFHSGFGHPMAFMVACLHLSCRRSWYGAVPILDVFLARHTKTTVPSLWDAPTAMSIQMPHKVFEVQYCASSTDFSREYQCTLGRGIEPSINVVPPEHLEVRASEIGEGAGLGLFALEKMKKGDLVDVTLDPVYISSHMLDILEDVDALWREGHDNAYHPVLDYMYFYGYEGDNVGVPEYIVEPGVAAFSNHGCHGSHAMGWSDGRFALDQLPYFDRISLIVDEATEVETVTALLETEDAPYLQGYNPVVERHLPHRNSQPEYVRRDLLPGDEITSNYLQLVRDAASQAEYVRSILQMCEGEQPNWIDQADSSQQKERRN